MHHHVKTLGLAVAAASLLLVSQARAAFIATMEQSGANVVVNGSGSVDLTGSSLNNVYSCYGIGVWPAHGNVAIGADVTVNCDIYSGSLTGPTNFGSGNLTSATSGSGDLFALQSSGTIVLPAGYTSGSSLLDSMTFDNATFVSLGVTPGTYEWTWGAPDDSFTLNIVSPVPEPASLALFAPALLGLGFMLRRKRG
jgi:PEP-CTERM motif